MLRGEEKGLGFIVFALEDLKMKKAPACDTLLWVCLLPVLMAQLTPWGRGNKNE
jgi:hypothetical protein